MNRFPFREFFFEQVKKTPGMVNCHAHLDRAYTVTPENWKQASALMEEKWILNRDIKKNHTEESLIERLKYCIDDFIDQGIIACRTHVDADFIVEMLVVDSAAKVRDEYKDRFILQLVPQPLEGLRTQEARDLYEKACDKCDVVGGLPSSDRSESNGDRKHMEFLISTAKNLGKDIDVHVDQENNPEEKDSEWILDMIEKEGMQGRVTFVHALSVSAQAEEDRKRIYKKMVDTGTNVTVCPWAVIGMKQHKDKVAPLHNSIAQVDEMIEAGVNVSVGTDNISDIFVPEDRGDLFEEIILMASACRYYDVAGLAKIATNNGAKALKLENYG
jgi:cytosine/creatinine deaminase